jgi:hypothetical protein
MAAMLDRLVKTLV